MMQAQHTYENVPPVDHHDDDSSTEVESLIGAEKKWHTDDFESRSRKPRRNMCLTLLKASRWILVIGLQRVIIGLMARDQGLLLIVQWKHPNQSTSASEVGGDMTGWGPHGSTHLAIYKALMADAA